MRADAVGVFRLAWIAMLAFGVAGCAPTQRIPLVLGPEPVELYVDGKRLEGAAPDFVELRADRSHIVMVKRDGYRSQQVALRSTLGGEGYRLFPAKVDVSLRPVERRGRSLRIELDEEGDDASPGPADASSPEN